MGLQQEIDFFGNYKLQLSAIISDFSVRNTKQSFKEPVMSSQIVDLILPFDVCSFINISLHHIVPIFVLNVEQS